MGTSRLRLAVIAALLLPTLTLAGVAAGMHQHDGLPPVAGYGDLPTFSGGHNQPDHATHIEGATPIDSPSCIGCLMRQRQRADASLEAVLGDNEPSSTAGAAESHLPRAADGRGLPASRAPPAA